MEKGGLPPLTGRNQNFLYFPTFTLSHFSHSTVSLFTLSHYYRRVEEGQEPVNLTGGPLAYKYQFQEMFFHWGEKVVIMIMMVMMVLLASLMVMVIMNLTFNQYE